MNARGIVIAALLVVAPLPLIAGQAQPVAAQPDVRVDAPASTADAAPPMTDDRWNAGTPAIVVETVARDGTNDAAFDPARKRPALTFADQQPLKPNMFDSPTAWEDEP